MEAMGHTPGVRVKCIVDLGHVGPGAMGKITQVIPETGSFMVQFDGASHETMVAPTHVQAIGYAPGDRVKCTINIGTVPAGTIGTVTEPHPEADASGVLFDGASSDMLVPNRYLEPAKPKALAPMEAIGYAAGARVRVTRKIGDVMPGTIGTVTEPHPEADASGVLFDGTSSDTLVPNRNLEPA